MILPGEKRRQPARRDIGLDRLGIEAVTGDRHRVRVNVARKHLQFDVALRDADLLAKQHGEGIGLFAGTAAGDPNPQRPIQGMIAHEIGNDALLEEIENWRVAKETRDVDQQIAGKLIALVGVANQEIQIGARALDRRHRHAPPDAAFERAMLVMGEVVDRLRAHEIDDLRQQSLHGILRTRVLRRWGEGVALFVADERLGDLRCGEHEIHVARRDCALGHAVIFGFAGFLRDDEAAFLLDRLEPKTAVRAGSRENHTDRPRAAFARQRVQQEVERQAHAVALLRSRKPQCAFVVHREIDAGRNDIDALAFDRHAVNRLHHRHRGVAGEQVDHHAGVARIEVLDEYEGHAVIGGQCVEQLPASVKAAGRGADRHNREIGLVAGGKGLAESTAAAPPFFVADDFQAFGPFFSSSGTPTLRSTNL